MTGMAKSELFTLNGTEYYQVPGLGGTHVEIFGLQPTDNYGRECLKWKELPGGSGRDEF